MGGEGVFPPLHGPGVAPMITTCIGREPRTQQVNEMSIDQSLRRKNTLARSRNVLTRAERINQLQNQERWQDGRSPYGLPKVRVLKVTTGKKKKAAKEEEAAEGAGATPTEAAKPAEKGKK